MDDVQAAVIAAAGYGDLYALGTEGAAARVRHILAIMERVRSELEAGQTFDGRVLDQDRYHG